MDPLLTLGLSEEVIASLRLQSALLLRAHQIMAGQPALLRLRRLVEHLGHGLLPYHNRFVIVTGDSSELETVCVHGVLAQLKSPFIALLHAIGFATVRLLTLILVKVGGRSAIGAGSMF